MREDETNLLGCNGRKFRAFIYEDFVEGMVFVTPNKRVYLCHNNRNRDGSSPSCGLPNGYKYSWVVGNGNPKDLKIANVKDFELIDKPSITTSPSTSDEALLLTL